MRIIILITIIGMTMLGCGTYEPSVEPMIDPSAQGLGIGISIVVAVFITWAILNK